MKHATLTFEQQVFRYQCAKHVYKTCAYKSVQSNTAWDVMCEVIAWAAPLGLVSKMVEAVK